MSDTAIEKREAEATPVERTHSGPTFVPNVDIVEEGNELLLIADVPGAQPENLDINYERGQLTICARVQPRQAGDQTDYLLREYGVGDFCRTFQIGESIDPEKINAELSAGVLTLHLPKAEHLRPRKIEVNAN